MIRRTLLTVAIVISACIGLHENSIAQVSSRTSGFKNEADSVYWWKYRRFIDGYGGYTRAEQTILDLMQKKGVRIQIGSKVKVLVRDPYGTVIENESFVGTVMRQRHLVFYTVRDSLRHDFEYHLFDIELPQDEISKLLSRSGETPKAKDPAKKNKQTGSRN